MPLLLLGVVLFGAGFGNATSLPPLIAQVEFVKEDVARVVGLIVGISQGGYAFAPALFGVIRELAPPPIGAAPAPPHTSSSPPARAGPRDRRLPRRPPVIICRFVLTTNLQRHPRAGATVSECSPIVAWVPAFAGMTWRSLRRVGTFTRACGGPAAWTGRVSTWTPGAGRRR